MKIIHYLSHARSLGLRVGLWVTQDSDPVDWPPQAISDIHIKTPTTLEDWDTIFFTWAPDWPQIYQRLSRPVPEQYIIHIIQHIRHINPDFINGYALHLLQTKSFSRICVSPEVSEAIIPYIRSSTILKTIPNVIDTRIFHKKKYWSPPSRPLKVLYANWKNTFGNQIRDHWQSTYKTKTITFESIDSPLSQQEFARQMRTSDIFIGTPNATEGFYLAPLEAMASEVAVICPDVVGNRSFCLKDITCLMPAYNDLNDHVQTLSKLFNDPILRYTIARNGYQKAHSRQWWNEREDFLCFLQSLPSAPNTTPYCNENVPTSIT